MPHRTGKEAIIPEFGHRLEGINYIDRPGAYAVIENNEKQIAVIQTANGYFLPGGGLNPGETEMDALHRELREETGYQISVLAEIGSAVEYIQASAEETYYRIPSRFYQARIESKTGEGMEQDHRLVWLPQGDAIRLITRQSQAWAVERPAIV